MDEDSPEGGGAEEDDPAIEGAFSFGCLRLRITP